MLDRIEVVAFDLFVYFY